MNRKEKEELVIVIKDLEKFKYMIIQKINRLVLDIEKILTEV